MFQYSQNISSKYPEKQKKLWGRKGPHLTLPAGLQKKQGEKRTWLRRVSASSAHLRMKLSCKIDVKNDPYLYRCEKMMLGSKKISWSSHTGVVSDPQVCLDHYYWPTVVNSKILPKRIQRKTIETKFFFFFFFFFKFYNF